MRQGRQPDSSDGSTRRLFTRFALISLLPVVALGVLLVALLRHQADLRGLAEGRAHAAIVTDTTVVPALTGHDLRSGLTAIEQLRLVDNVRSAMRTGQVLRLRLRSLDGQVVYASDGTQGEVDDDVGEAADGATVEHVGRLNADSIGASTPGPDTVEVYQPLTIDGRRIGVVELYLPYVPIATDISRGQQSLAVALPLGLLLLWSTLLVMSMSVTRRIRRHADLHAYLATHDPLTELPNRAEFRRLGAAAVAAGTAEMPAVVAIVAVDDVQQVNETLGPAMGEALLVATSRRLRDNLRDGDLVARLGGEEFGLILAGVHGPSEAVEILTRLRGTLVEPADVHHLPMRPLARIGFALAPADGDDLVTLLARAEMAARVAKTTRCAVMHYQARLDQHLGQARWLLAELGAAIEQDQLRLHFQPKAVLPGGEISEVEALVRWEHPTKGLLYPDTFLPAAEQTELIQPLTRWVLHEALRALPELDPSGRLVVAVNVSARTLPQPGLVEMVQEALDASGVRPERLVLEMTETALLIDPPRAAETIARLTELGVRTSLDDFGVGQTSLSYLATLPLAELKIDKRFVLAMQHDCRSAAIVRSVVELGHSLGLTVTAEGVESEIVRDVLADLGCDMMQGYLLSRPQPAARLREFLAARRAERRPVVSDAGAR